MILEEVVETKSKLSKAADYIAPFKQPKIGVQLGQAYQLAVQNPEVREAFSQATPEEQRALIDRLSYHVQAARRGTRLLRYSAGLVDTIDKLAVPTEDAAEGTIIGYPIGVALKLAQMPFKALHSLHYAVKAREPTAPVRDVAWEAASFVVPANIMDLSNRYADRAVKYVPHHAAKGFINELRSKKKKRGFVDIAEGFRNRGQTPAEYESYQNQRGKENAEEGYKDKDQQAFAA
jgi:hypothetical protein